MIFEKIRETFRNIHRVVECDEDLEWNRAVYKCTTIVDEVEAEYNSGWISVDDKLPNETQKSYLIYYKRHGGLNGCYNLSFVSKDYFMSDKRWEIEDRFPDAKVTHWQPLPQPPKGE